MADTGAPPPDAARRAGSLLGILTMSVATSPVVAAPFLIPHAVRVGLALDDVRILPIYCPKLKAELGTDPCRDYGRLTEAQAVSARQAGAWMLDGSPAHLDGAAPPVVMYQSGADMSHAQPVGRETFGKLAEGFRVTDVESLGRDRSGAEQYANLIFEKGAPARIEAHFNVSVVLRGTRAATVFFGEERPVVYDYAFYRAQKK